MLGFLEIGFSFNIFSLNILKQNQSSETNTTRFLEASNLSLSGLVKLDGFPGGGGGGREYFLIWAI